VNLAPLVNHQRSVGDIVLSVGQHGLRRLRESGAAKVRLPFDGHEAILINTGGGLAGGDRFSFDIAAEENAQLTVTTQAAERVYRSLGPAATVDITLRVAAGAMLHWLPQETILFDGSSLARSIAADLAPDARFLGVESVILGRAAMGETVRHARLRDRWRINQGGRLVFADDLAFEGEPPATRATLGDAKAFATVVLVADDADALLDRVRQEIGGLGGASAWSGKLVARLAAGDGFELRKALIPALTVLARGAALPKVWSF
jgi:urease accessory protein